MYLKIAMFGHKHRASWEGGAEIVLKTFGVLVRHKGAW